MDTCTFFESSNSFNSAFKLSPNNCVAEKGWANLQRLWNLLSNSDFTASLRCWHDAETACERTETVSVDNFLISLKTGIFFSLYEFQLLSNGS